MRCIAALLLAAPVAPALAALAQASTPQALTGALYSTKESLALHQLRGRQLYDADMVDEEDATTDPGEEAPVDEATPETLEELDVQPEVGSEAGAGQSGSEAGVLPERPPEASGQFPARPNNAPGGTNPFGTACIPLVENPATTTQCSQSAYRAESQCITVPGCTWTLAGGCIGAFNSTACIDMTQEVCESSFFCLYDATFEPTGPETQEPAQPPIGGLGGGSGLPFGGSGDPRSQFGDDEDDASARNGGWTGGFGVRGRDTVGPGGAAIDGDGSAGVLSWSPVTETPLTPYIPSSSSPKLPLSRPILMSAVLGTVVAVVSAWL